MKEKLRDLVDYYRELAQKGDIKISLVLDDLEKLLEEFPDPKPSKFFEFNQNNSGGNFHIDPKAGISVIVIIEAPSGRIADSIAESIGIEFDSGCECCGDRWRRVSWDEGKEVPTYYGTPVLTSKFEGTKWNKKGPEGYIHYLDGRVVSFWE